MSKNIEQENKEPALNPLPEVRSLVREKDKEKYETKVYKCSSCNKSVRIVVTCLDDIDDSIIIFKKLIEEYFKSYTIGTPNFIEDSQPKF
jgi:hypothetical protein